jgi:hypothetical protein
MSTSHAGPAGPDFVQIGSGPIDVGVVELNPPPSRARPLGQAGDGRVFDWIPAMLDGGTVKLALVSLSFRPAAQ